MKLGTLIVGGTKWARAIATGDRASQCDAAQRHAACCDCPSMKTTAVPVKVGASFQTCGEFAQETRSTCGCVVGVTYEGASFPAGKVRVGSERCPQGRW